MKSELAIVNDFAELIGSKIIGIIPYSHTVKECGGQGKTVFECAPQSEETTIYRNIGENIFANRDLVIPKEVSFKELYSWWLKYIN
jgi:nitrogenase iron protein NifH